MDLTVLVSGLDDKQLGELGDALKTLPPRRLARVLSHLSSGHRLPNRVEYHVVMGTRQLLSSDGSQLTSADITNVERQMMG
jgi:hypothetical protein